MAAVEKRPLNDEVFNSKHILLDIEGTTTSISFVKDTLFPYVRQNLDKYISSHWDEEEFKSVLSLLKDQVVEDKKADLDGVVEIPSEGPIDEQRAAAVKNVLWQMDSDRKTTALKKLQGHMWRQGYKSGELQGHLFADVAPALRQWVDDGRKLYVYSSGSVEAQKLLFGHSTEGDLTKLFTDFFDTEMGAKVEADSYKAIQKKLNCSADEILFLTDVSKEALAARKAGLPVVLVQRDGNEPLVGDVQKEFSAVSSFQELSFDKSSKKLKLSSEKDLPEENGHCEPVPNGQVESEDITPMDVEKADSEVTSTPASFEKAEHKSSQEGGMEVDLPSKEATAENDTVKTTDSVTSKAVDGTEVKPQEKCVEIDLGSKDNLSEGNEQEVKPESTKAILTDALEDSAEVCDDSKKKVEEIVRKESDPVASDSHSESNKADEVSSEENNRLEKSDEPKVEIEQKDPPSVSDKNSPKSDETLNEGLPSTNGAKDDVSSVDVPEKSDENKTPQGKTEESSDTTTKTDNIPVASPREIVPLNDNVKDACETAVISEQKAEPNLKSEHSTETDSPDKTEGIELKTDGDTLSNSEDVSDKTGKDSDELKDEKSGATETASEDKATEKTDATITETPSKEVNGIESEIKPKENGSTIENGHKESSPEKITNVVTKNNSNSQVDTTASETEVAVEA